MRCQDPTSLPICRRDPRAQQGFSLVELLVAIVIGLVLTLTLTTVITQFEGSKRGMNSANEQSITSAFTSFEFDRQLRSAGSGFVQSAANNNTGASFGCRLQVARNGAQILPRLTAFPAPFNNVPQQISLAPVMVFAGAGTGGSDVLMLAAGASGLGETALRISPNSATPTSLRITNTLGMRGGDLMLLIDPSMGGNCMLQQVATPFAGGASQLLNFGGAYASQQIGGTILANIATTSASTLVPLGNITGNRPNFKLMGIGANATLYYLDLLRLDNVDTAQAMSDGIVDLRVLYGVDSDSDGRVDSWVSPAAGNFTAAALSNGTPAAQANLLSIRSLRIGMILRSERIEREAVNSAPLTLFGDFAPALKVTRNLSADEQRQRFRTLEFTVPLRNML
ncbi:PilW family protein [Paucibacter sp. KCTC 42545]|uniref:PilW family protein n=1 Tax=Paucibacter sp. KCTC 42545 TaxID=1768242 RepID=UPI000733A872|nr:PilW family protein [Paucibacter sp. KCTC 42545]ALT78281.1 hypothetical protein AT984_14890 [Paucibacter sp. KCTC 42545]